MTIRSPLHDLLASVRSEPLTRDDVERHVQWADDTLNRFEQQDIVDAVCRDSAAIVEYRVGGHYADARRAVARIEATYGSVFNTSTSVADAQRHAEHDALDERGLADLITRKGA